MGQGSRGLSHARPWEDWHSRCLIQTNQERCQAAPLGPTFSSTSETSPNAQFLQHASQVGTLGVGPERCIVLSPLSCVCLYGVDACACIQPACSRILSPPSQTRITGEISNSPGILRSSEDLSSSSQACLASVLTTNHLPSSGMCIFDQ